MESGVEKERHLSALLTLWRVHAPRISARRLPSKQARQPPHKPRASPCACVLYLPASRAPKSPPRMRSSRRPMLPFRHALAAALAALALALPVLPRVGAEEAFCGGAEVYQTVGER